MDFIKIFDVTLDLSTICLPVLVSVELSLSYSILDSYNPFSGVKSSIRSFYFICVDCWYLFAQGVMTSSSTSIHRYG